MQAIPVIAIFDVGKTNKKFFLFDVNYHIVHERTAQFPETEDEEGFACDNVVLLQNWLLETLSGALQMPQFDIKGVNFSAYGASFVLLDENSNVIAPLYNYLKPFPQELSGPFYQLYGGEEAVATETASPVLGSLNSGLQLYRLKHEQPQLFGKIKMALHLPQFLSFLVTKQPVSDITSIGCHTQLWNFEKNRYHTWVEKEGISNKLAPVFPSDVAIPATIDSKEIIAGTGLHDSSAALIPYLTCFSEPFVLISTGTWCITLNPYNSQPLTAEELKADCLCYMQFSGRPVKASRLFAGNEHEVQTRRLSAHYGETAEFYKSVKYDAALTEALLAAPAFQPDRPVGLQESVFGQRDLQVYESYEEAYHQLIIDIVAEQKISTERVIQNTPVKRIFVDGGFSHNAIYMHLLAAAFPQMEVFAASVAQATAVGAALAIHSHWNPNPVPGDMIELKFYTVPHTHLAG